jgi:crossover junction endodeoxyribonuclease RusA
MVTVSLPLPDRCLSPNARSHWAVRSKAAKRQHAVAFFETVEVLEMPGVSLGTMPNQRLTTDQNFGVRCRWFFRDRRRRDADNLLASMKHAFDGIAEALEVDDRTFVHWPAEIQYDRERPRVEVSVWTMDSEGQGATPCRPSPSSEPMRPS